MKKDLIISIENLEKDYILGTVSRKTLRDDIKKHLPDFLRKNTDYDRANNEKFVALAGIDLEIEKGEVVGIIGPNGAGKSTLLKIISRITTPTKGRVLLNGTISSMLEVGTGFHGELTGRENIYLNGSILGMSKEEIDHKMDSIISFSECEKFIDTPVKRYSSGMYVKLAFSVAAHLDADIMIMDEVLAVGDLQFQNKCIAKMKEIAETRNKTVLFVSHNMDTIRRLCKRCIVLEKGKVVFDGDMQKAVNLYLGEEDKDLEQMSGKRCYQKLLREGWLKKQDIRFTEAKFIQNKEIYNEDDTSVSIHLQWVSHRNVTNLGIRIEVASTYPIGTAVIPFLYNGGPNEEAGVDIDIDISHLSGGDYQTKFIAYYKDAYGQIEDIDCVPGLKFRIDRDISSGIRWNSESWGNVIISGSAHKN